MGETWKYYVKWQKLDIKGHVVEFNLCEMSGINKPIETEKRWGLLGAGGEENGEWLLHGDGVSLWGGETILGLESDDGSTICEYTK